MKAKQEKDMRRLHYIPWDPEQQEGLHDHKSALLLGANVITALLCY